jgi:hypothetical protein
MASAFPMSLPFAVRPSLVFTTAAMTFPVHNPEKTVIMKTTMMMTCWPKPTPMDPIITARRPAMKKTRME